MVCILYGYLLFMISGNGSPSALLIEKFLLKLMLFGNHIGKHLAMIQQFHS